MKTLSYAAAFVVASAVIVTALNIQDGEPDSSHLTAAKPVESGTALYPSETVDASGETILVATAKQSQPDIKPKISQPSETESMDAKSEIFNHHAESPTADSTEHDFEEQTVPSEEALAQLELPGEEINFNLKLFSKTLYHIDGRAESDIGKILFDSLLMPSNEVKLSVKLKQGELEDIQFLGYFDLANFTMELDGANAVLNKQHKELLSVLDTHLRAKLPVHYREYDFPEHAFLLMQMLSYWSVSPEGYVHEKREIVASY